MEKIQQEFEEWAKTTSLKNFLFWHPSDNQYEVHAVQMAFEGWKASRASLCVELPPKYNYRYPEPFNDGFDCAVEEIEETLCKCGVPYK